jgi:hypothetical protein
MIGVHQDDPSGRSALTVTNLFVEQGGPSPGLRGQHRPRRAMSGAVETNASAARFRAAKEARLKVEDSKEDGVVVELTHGDLVRETVERMAERGFAPTVLIFHNEAHEVEVFTRGVELEPFFRWMVEVWIPGSRDRHAGQGAGH